MKDELFPWSIEKFYQYYANTPMASRFKVLDFAEHGTMTLNELYHRVHQLDDEMRPKRIEQGQLLKAALKFYDDEASAVA